MSAPQAFEAADLAASALPNLYEQLPGILPVLADEFSVDGTELAEAAVLAGQQVDGLVACYPADEYETRQRNSLHHALRSLDEETARNFIERLRALSMDIPKAGLSGDYVARFAVRPALQGSGTADQLMNLLVTKHPVMTLHVRRDNERAIRFYARHGFVSVVATMQTLLMRRS